MNNEFFNECMSKTCVSYENLSVGYFSLIDIKFRGCIQKCRLLTREEEGGRRLWIYYWWHKQNLPEGTAVDWKREQVKKEILLIQNKDFLGHYTHYIFLHPLSYFSARGSFLWTTYYAFWEHFNDPFGSPCFS